MVVRVSPYGWIILGAGMGLTGILLVRLRLTGYRLVWNGLVPVEIVRDSAI